MRKTAIIITLALAVSMHAKAQGYIQTEYLSTSDMNDKHGDNHGSGDMLRVKGRYTLPFSAKNNERDQPVVWSATLSASYAMMSNKGEAAVINPDDIINASINVTHVSPLSEHCKLIATLGAGIYAAPDEIRFRSLLANGAAIFAYKFSDNLSAGVGVGLTNSYGVPLVMPMGYIEWRTAGDIKVQANLAGGMTLKASTMLGKRFGIELTAIDIDGMSAVRRIDGESKIYSMTMIRSSLTPTLCLSKKAKLLIGIGGTWLRTVKVTDRSLKAFFNSFSDDEGKYRFRPTMRVNVGVSYGL